MRSAICFAIVAMLAGCRDKSSPPPPAAEPPRPSPPHLLQKISVMATGGYDDAFVSTWQATLAKNPEQIDAYIDALIAKPEFGHDLVPAVLFKGVGRSPHPYANFPLYELKTEGEGDNKVYFLKKPCSASEAVSIVPWWNIINPARKEEPIRLCPEAHRPESVSIKGTHNEVHCFSIVGSEQAGTACGCGTNLVRCTLPDARVDDKDMLEELRDTIQYLVEHDQPLQDIYTSNSTVRGRDAEFLYRRWQIEAGKIKDPVAYLRELREWPAEGKLAPRKEWSAGSQAGVLTTPQIMMMEILERQRSRELLHLLWCTEITAVGATAEAVFSVADHNSGFVGDAAWKELAARPVCTNCHARLDYGMQFFTEYPVPAKSAQYLYRSGPVPIMPMYFADIDDPRGSAPATPANYAKLVLAQPEFERCILRRFGEQVFGDALGPAEMSVLEAAYKRSTNPKEIVRAALKLYAATYSRAQDMDIAAMTAPPAVALGEQNGDRMLQVPQALHAMLTEACSDCHDNDDKLSLMGPSLPDTVLVQALVKVAAGQMPKNEPWSRDRRLNAVRMFAEAVWSGSQQRLDIVSRFIDEQPLSALEIQGAFGKIRSGVGVEKDPPDTKPAALLPITAGATTFTPAFVADTALEATRACKQKGATDLVACIGAQLGVTRLGRYEAQ